MLAALAFGCAGAVDRPAIPALPPDVVGYLRQPLEGYPLGVDGETARRLESAHADLTRGDIASALQTAAEVLNRTPGFHPALVLEAEAALLERRYSEAVDRLRPVLAELPDYLAGQLVLGRASELVGDLVGAFEAFRSVAERDRLAAGRAEELRPRALEIVANRVGESLRRGRLEAAADGLAKLESWAPDETVTLETARRVAAASGDPAGELRALRRLSDRLPDDDVLLRRRAELEVEHGDAGAGLRILQQLSAARPADLELAHLRRAAELRWRLLMTPPEVQDLARLPELSRADFARLLFWLFPAVRYGHPDEGWIASDVLDHPHKQEIIRVVNLGLMDVDPTVHRFEPAQPVIREEALAGFLRLLAKRQPRAACLGGSFVAPDRSTESVCRAAASCRLIPEENECLPSATVSGAWVVESQEVLARLGLE